MFVIVFADSRFNICQDDLFARTFSMLLLPLKAAITLRITATNPSVLMFANITIHYSNEINAKAP